MVCGGRGSVVRVCWCKCVECCNKSAPFTTVRISCLTFLQVEISQAHNAHTVQHTPPQNTHHSLVNTPQPHPHPHPLTHKHTVTTYACVHTLLLSPKQLHEVLLDAHLCVAEEEDHLIALQACLEQNTPDVVPPLLHTVVLGQLNLKAVILRPTQAHRGERGQCIKGTSGNA